MKRLFSFCIVSILIVALTACSFQNLFVAESTEEESVITEFSPLNDVVEGQPDVYLIIKSVSSVYWKSIVKSAKASGLELGCNIYCAGTTIETDWKGQQMLIDDAVSKGADAIILAPDDSVRLVEDVEKLRKNHIPIILIDTIINSDDYDVCYMTENMVAGRTAAAEMIRQLHKEGHSDSEELSVGIIVGNIGTQTIAERLAGFYKYWSEQAPKTWTISADIMNQNGDPDAGLELITEFLDNNTNVAGIYSTNNSASQTLADVVMERKYTDMVIVGFDCSDEMKALIESDDYIAAAVVQRQYLMSYNAVNAAKILINGGTIENKFVDTGVIIVNSENISDSDVQEVLSRN